MGKKKENAYEEQTMTKARHQEKNPNNNPCLAVDVSADGRWGEGGVCDSEASFICIHDSFIERQINFLGRYLFISWTLFFYAGCVQLFL
jgi:hypothetical protein